MMKAPTNSDTRAKATSTVLKVLMAFSKMSWFSLVNAAPVMACVPGRQAGGFEPAHELALRHPVVGRRRR